MRRCKGRHRDRAGQIRRLPQREPKVPVTTARARAASPDFETIEPVTLPSPEVTPCDLAGERPLPILSAETSLWSMGITAFLLAPMATAAVAIAPVMVANKLLPNRLLP